jgi:hypothetical protein
MNISDVKSLNKIPKRGIEIICNNLESVHIKKKRKRILKQTQLFDYFEKENNSNLYKNKIYYKNNNMSSEQKKYLLNLELEDNSEIKGTFIIESNYNEIYEFIPITNNIKIKNKSEQIKIYKCIYNKNTDIMIVQCGVKTIEQKIKECRGFKLKYLNL